MAGFLCRGCFTDGTKPHKPDCPEVPVLLPPVDFRSVALELLTELERDYSHGIANGYYPEMAAKVDRWRAALGLPVLLRYARGMT